MRRLTTAAVLVLLAVPAAAAQRWELRSNFWVNLHQNLYEEAQGGKQLEAQGLTDLEAKLWRDAVNTYNVRFYNRSPIVDDELIRINDALSEATNLPPEGFDEPVTRALLSAAPVYRKYRWPTDDRSNQFWISVTEGMLRDAGEDLARAHNRVYGVPLPAKIRVDVTTAAGPAGAYTTIGSLIHTTITSNDPKFQGYAALEMLLHEASHVIAGVATGVIGPEITALASTRSPRLLPPRELWHAILYYTSGELTRRALAERGIKDYVPILYKQQMFERAFSGLQTPLETYWRSYIDGKMQRDAAITAIVEATSNQAPPRNGG
jgi:hypothetical protein